MVRFCGSNWEVSFGAGAVRKLGQQVASEDGSLKWLETLLPRLEAGDPEALVYTLWAGLGAEKAGFTPMELLILLDDCHPGELEALPLDLLEALVDSLPRKGKGGGGGTGQPWDWNVAAAVWSTVWGQPAAEFANITLREFHDLSDGRSLLFASAQEGGAHGPDAQKVTTMGGWLELLNLKG